jgi:protein-S-isoprenylcysteine O-methyltransferase Ste14
VLGKQWRVDAGLNAEHELVMCGPYRIVRHPIYTSVLCVLWGTGFILLPVPLILLATIPALIGTEIRVRIEDGLLASRFGKQFDQYKRSVSAYFPFVR